MTGTIPWPSEIVASALGVPGPAGLVFDAVSTDTRAIHAGDLFVALQGERFDAHDFLVKAREQGARAAVVRQGTPAVAGLPFFEVPDTLVALGNLARARRRRLPVGAPVVAITGSSGKTSTKELIRAALAPRFRVHATAGNLNNLVGVPLTILAAPVDTQALVVEAGANLPGEVARLRDIIEPTIAVVTNVGYAHVEGFGSLAGVMAEKVSLLERVPLGVVGTEPPELALEARRRTQVVVVAGRGGSAQVHPDAADLDDEGHPVLEWGEATVTLPVTGFHQIENAALAVAVARGAGVPVAEAVAGLAAAHLPGGRGAVSAVRGLLVIDDSYNANPGSLSRAVEFARWLATRHHRPLAIVVGTMLELGGESGRLHAAAAAEIVAAGPALVGAVGAFGPAFAPHKGVLSRLLVAPDAEGLGSMLAKALRGDEVVLLKASRGVELERVLRYLN